MLGGRKAHSFSTPPTDKKKKVLLCTTSIILGILRSVPQPYYLSYPPLGRLVKVWEAGWEGATLHPAIPGRAAPWNSIYRDNMLDQRWELRLVIHPERLDKQYVRGEGVWRSNKISIIKNKNINIKRGKPEEG